MVAATLSARSFRLRRASRLTLKLHNRLEGDSQLRGPSEVLPILPGMVEKDHRHAGCLELQEKALESVEGIRRVLVKHFPESGEVVEDENV